MKSHVEIADNRLRLTRTFDAPRPLVFGWWSQPEKLQRWSGCKEATRCQIVMDFRPGGGFTQKMELGGKCEFTLTATYDEIVVPERISYRVDLGSAVTRVVVEFFEQDGRTKVVLTQEGFPDSQSCQIVTQGTVESLDKLEALLAVQPVAL